jgi:hypothetical protein
VVEGHRRWIISPPMVSFYTLLVRLGFSHKVGSAATETTRGIMDGSIKAYQPVDRSRLTGSWSGIERIMNEGDRKIFGSDMAKNYPASVGANAVHGLGIMGFSSEYTKTVMPNWYKK